MNSKLKLKNGNSEGFTLVELLVVISIIAMLLALIMPALSKAKAKAMQVICKSNMKQIGSALTVYAQEYNNKYPEPNTFGRFPYRPAPGFMDPRVKRGIPEKWGIAAILGKVDIWGKSPKGAYIDGHSKVWICPSGGKIRLPVDTSYKPTMAELGNSYAFSSTEILRFTRLTDKKIIYSNGSAGNAEKHDIPLLWDNIHYILYDVGWPQTKGESGYTIPTKDRVYPHQWTWKENKKDTNGERSNSQQGLNRLYFDLSVDIGYNR
jgi:prepilin-type N-terminal cleavage/methylation domain-containing protein